MSNIQKLSFMNKDLRKLVYRKFDGKCAYCGNYLEYKDLKIDHFIPKKLGGTEEFENLMPSCEICNHYKGHSNIFKFKSMMQNIHNKISKLYIVKVAEKFGLITIKKFTSFYYEDKM